MAWLLRNKKFLSAVGVLIGTMVGVGIFGIPFAFSKSGFFIGLGFLLLVGGITLIVNLMYGEVVLRTEKNHQLVGYTQLYLSPVWKHVVLFANSTSIYAGLLAYMVIAGNFLSNIFSPLFYFAPAGYSAVFWMVGSFLVFLGLKRVAWLEIALVSTFMAVILLIVAVGIPKIEWPNLVIVNWEAWFLPYGVLLFAFAGISAIPMQREILFNSEKYLKKAILTAVIIVGALYLVFGFVTLGVSGEGTLPDAISGLYPFLGGKIVLLGSIFGALAVSTSFFMLGSALLEMYQLDYGIKRIFSWLLVIVPPGILFMGGLRNFIDVVSLGGSIGMAPLFIALMLTYIKAKRKGDRIPEYSMSLPVWMPYLLMVILISGVAFALIWQN